MIICLGISQVQAADYFIDSGKGSDSSPGSKYAPWQTIAKANMRLQAGDTVFIRAGNYEETIRPVNSGQPGKYITYTAYNGEDVVIGGDITYGADLSNRAWVKIDGLQFTDTTNFWIQFNPNGNYNFVANCDFSSIGDTMGWAGLYMRYANHNKIINNKLTSACKPSDLMNVRSSSYNLIEGNFFGYCNHTALVLRSYELTNGQSEYNIVRKNTFQNKYHHNLSLYGGADHTLVEGNMILDAGDDCNENDCPQNRCGSERDRTQMRRQDHDGIKVASKYCIFRNNVLINNGNFGLATASRDAEIWQAVGNRVYNNTHYNNYQGWQGGKDGPQPMHDNIAKNNIFSESILWNLNIRVNATKESYRFMDNRFHDARVIYRYQSGISDIESHYPDEFQGNDVEISDPGFKNADNRILELRDDSELIDAGAWLTTITSSSGSGTTFRVEDARYFTDGFDLMQGDSVQIENQKTVSKIKSVNYSDHTIVLDRTVSWKKGDGISLPYTGKLPDVGAYEFNDLVPPRLFIVQN